MRNLDKTRVGILSIFTLTILTFIACSSDDTTIDGDDGSIAELHKAYEAFNTDATTIYVDGSNIVIETTGLPNHETVYWGEGNDLYREESNVALTPSIMSSNNNATSIRVDATPDLTGNTVATNFNTIGIAVSEHRYLMTKKVVEI